VTGPSGVVDYDETLGLRTDDAVSPSIGASQVLASLIGFGVIYLSLLVAWIYILDRKIRHGPDTAGHGPGEMDGLLATAASRADHSESLIGSDGPG
jgi:cytochrome d ubiquinol oxidase subunit I